MQLEEEDILDSSLLESMDYKLMVSPTPTDETVLLDDYSRPQGA